MAATETLNQAFCKEEVRPSFWLKLRRTIFGNVHCHDCAHYRLYPFTERCVRPDLSQGRNLVSGEFKTFPEEYCDESRKDEARCGKLGRWFKQKEFLSGAEF